ncbi:pectate lyase [Tamlana flava]|uniref:pectate lyase n=1 Tax=Tamlana flava TaxID=3158572 RepID=UPI00351B2635
MRRVFHILPIVSLLFFGWNLKGQSKISKEQVEETMIKATKFMVEEVSTNGGYLWFYMPDFSRQWGEMEAYKTMIWLQNPGTISMGHVFLDAYRSTQDEYYYKAAEKAARAIIWGQSEEGGWNYMIDFAGDRSLKQWYNTIGKNGWRLEEFQHYYGNSTFDDDVTTDAARFLLRIYLEKMDPTYKPALDKAIDFVLKSQYPKGGWPQRYPLRHDFEKQGFPDYSSFYTFNDDVIWENINFLMQCYLVLGQERFLDPIYRGMDFYKISQDSCGAWGQQINMNMEAASARTYEPAAFLPSATCENAMLLIKFYRLTGDKKYLEGIPKTIKWLEEVKLPEDKIEGHRTHSTFIDAKTNKPIYVHRKGSNVKFGRYYVDEDDKNLLSHYYGKAYVRIDELKNEYQNVLVLSAEEVTKDSPLIPEQFMFPGTPQTYYDLNRFAFNFKVEASQVEEVVNGLDSQNRWLTTRAYISNPYIGDGKNTSQTDKYATTRVGDETDTSPFPNETNQEYISTRTYIRNMKLLINFINSKEN